MSLSWGPASALAHHHLTGRGAHVPGEQLGLTLAFVTPPFPGQWVSQRTLLPGNAARDQISTLLGPEGSGLRPAERESGCLVICSEEVARNRVPKCNPTPCTHLLFFNGAVVTVDLISVGLRGGQEKKAAWGQTVPWELGVLAPNWPREAFASTSGVHYSPGSMLREWLLTLAYSPCKQQSVPCLTSLPCDTGALAVAVAQEEKPRLQIPK